MSLLSNIIIAAVVIFAFSGIRIVRPTHRALIETLGKFTRVQEQGFTWIMPIIQKSYYVNITEQMVDVQPQTVITKDNLNAVVDAVVYYQIRDIKSSVYNVDDNRVQLTSLARTTLRAVIGQMAFSDANENRDKINQEIELILDKETKSYGVDVLRVEIQKIEAPQHVQEAMNDVVIAERKKIAAKDFANAVEIEADGKKRASIREAEGQKEAEILKAEGQAKAFEMVNKSFVNNAQLLKQLEVLQASLENNTKIVLTEKGISPSIIMDAMPIKMKKDV